MPTATLSVTHDNDLASLGWRELTSEWYFIVHPADLDIGHITLDTYKQGHCLRFRNFPIPPGSKILYAYLKYHSWSDYDVDVVRCYIKAEKALNPQPFTTWADYSGRTRTDEKQDWSEIPHWKLNRRYNSIDFAAVVKEVIDQPGWAAGNPFVIFCDDLDDRSDHLFGCTRHAHARWEWPERAPQLHLSWIQPYEEPPPIQPGESYTITGTAFFKLLENYQNGQTFTPQTEHILDYIDIDLKTGPITAKVTIDIYEAGLDHKPVGDPLSSSTTTVHSILPGTVKRVRFTMHSRPPLSPDSEYIFAIYHKPILLGSRAEVLYDHFDSTYPRGHRLVSLDAGETWTLKLDQDTIFTEFGHPPLPKPLPPPPIDRFAVIGIGYQPIPEGIRVAIPTNTPCHLTCYWTDKPPLKHPTARRVRGIMVPWQTYFCFVAWKAVEQTEPGDTLSHTFNLTPWEYCETRWFTFRGEVDNIESLSVGPIFQKHRLFGPFTRFEYYVGPSNTAFSTDIDNKLAQTFTPQESHQLTQVKLMLSRTGTPGVMHVAIEGTTPTSRPDDVILTSGAFDGNLLPLDPPGPPALITVLINPYQLEAGTLYAKVLYGGDNTNKVRWRAQDGNPYPRGRSWAWVEPPGNWFSLLTFDLLFEEWGYII